LDDDEIIALGPDWGYPPKMGGVYRYPDQRNDIGMSKVNGSFSSESPSLPRDRWSQVV
jgi:hypothetical protein